MKALWIVLAMATTACRAAAPPPPPGSATMSLDTAQLVDMSYTFDDTTLYWPTSPLFDWHADSWGTDETGRWYASATLTTSEHGGTHLDAPIHFAEGRWTTAAIPIDHLVGPAVVIDISAACQDDRNYRLTPEDLTAWEASHRRIAPGDIVLVRTGWGQYWPDAAAYLGTERRGDASELSFPGISDEAAALIVDRGADGVGIDTASIDYGMTTEYPAHRTLASANVFILENVASLDRLPATGATLIALPMKIGPGSGGPTRIVGVLP